MCVPGVVWSGNRRNAIGTGVVGVAAVVVDWSSGVAVAAMAP